jgi:hypothetical protein
LRPRWSRLLRRCASPPRAGGRSRRPRRCRAGCSRSPTTLPERSASSGTCQRMLLVEPVQQTLRLDAAVAAQLPHPSSTGAPNAGMSCSRRTPPPALPNRDHPAAREAGLGRVRFHRQTIVSGSLAPTVSPGDIQHMHAGHLEQGVDARAIATTLRESAIQVNRNGAFSGYRYQCRESLSPLIPSGSQGNLQGCVLKHTGGCLSYRFVEADST